MRSICVDIGNSGMRCVKLKSIGDEAAPWEADLLRVDWQAGDDNLGQLRSAISGGLAGWLGSDQRPSRWLVSSVQRTMQGLLAEYVTSRAGDVLRLVTHQDLGWQVLVEQPGNVGIDRLLAGAAAAKRYPHRPLVVVQAGSAITVDWIEPPNRFCGGAIMPGVPMMLRLLSKAADLLPEVAANELLELPPLPGRHTAAAMAAGVSSAVVGGVQHLIARYRDRSGADTLVVISGGDGPRLSPHVLGPYQVVDHLVLRGLADLAGQTT